MMARAPHPPEIPSHLEVFPEIAMAALKRQEDGTLICWTLWRVADLDGRGYLRRAVACQVLRARRRIGARQARRLVAQGAGRYWTVDAQDRLWLWAAADVAARLGIEWLSRPHRVPAADLCAGRAQRRAALEALVYRTDDRGRPLSRRLVRELTGVPESTQRRYENQYGHARVVDPVHVQLTHITREATKTAIVYAYPKNGFYFGGSGDLMRRHADRRQAARHLPGSGAKARRANTHLAKSARLDSPAMKARGERSSRAFFPTSPSGRSGHQAWLRATHALGKPGNKAEIVDAVFDYGVVETIGKSGRPRYESVTIPDDPRDPRSGGSRKQGKGLASCPDPEPPPPSASYSRPNEVRPRVEPPKEA